MESQIPSFLASVYRIEHRHCVSFNRVEINMDVLEFVYTIPHTFFQVNFPPQISSSIELTLSSCAEDLLQRAAESEKKKASIAHLIAGIIFKMRFSLAPSGETTLELSNFVGTGSFKKVQRIVDIFHQRVFARAKIKGWRHMPSSQLSWCMQSIETEFSWMVFCREHHVRHVPEPFNLYKHEHLSIGFDFEYFSEGDADRFSLSPPDSIAELKTRLHVLQDLAQTISDLHSLGLAHTDLKPQNIILKRDARGAIEAMLSDFGGIGRVGNKIAQYSFLFSDYQTRQELGHPNATISIDSNLWALGLFIFNFTYGEQENPICNLFEKVPELPVWNEACSSLLTKLHREHPIDDLIYSIIAPERHNRPPAAIIAARLEAIITTL